MGARCVGWSQAVWETRPLPGGFYHETVHSWKPDQRDVSVFQFLAYNSTKTFCLHTWQSTHPFVSSCTICGTLKGGEALCRVPALYRWEAITACPRWGWNRMKPDERVLRGECWAQVRGRAPQGCWLFILKMSNWENTSLKTQSRMKECQTAAEHSLNRLSGSGRICRLEHKSCFINK